MLIQTLCIEANGPIIRTVYRPEVTMDLLTGIYEKVKGIPNFVTAHPSRFGPESMAWLLLPSIRFFLVDDVGIIVLQLRAERRADVHITFWDRRLRGRERLASRVATQLIFDHHLERLETAIPRSSKATLAFAKRVGFITLSRPGDEIQHLVLQHRVLS